jgi:hypothetical protein
VVVVVVTTYPSGHQYLYQARRWRRAGPTPDRIAPHPHAPVFRKERISCLHYSKKRGILGCSCWSNNTSTSILQHHSKMAGGVSCVLLISTVDQQASEDFYIYATGCSQLEATKACQLPYKFLILQHGLTLFSN